MYKKLITTATSRAGTIASLSGRQLGKIISVQERSEETRAGGWTAYPPLGALRDVELPGWHVSIGASEHLLNTDSPINNVVPIAKTLIVRFAIE